MDSWRLVERELDLERLAQSESLFALSNGHIGLRGNLDEGEPHSLPGSYLNSLYELRPLPYAEAGYGYPESGQSVINVTNGKPIRMLVDDEPFDVRYGELHRHERVLDFRDGVLRRDLEWTSPAGRRVAVKSTRLVSFVQRSVVAIQYEVTPVDEPVRIVLQSELIANEQLPSAGNDPRVAAVMEAPLEEEEVESNHSSATLVHRTRRSGLRMAAMMDHQWDGDDDVLVTVNCYQDLGRVTLSTTLDPGQTFRLTKLVGYGWSSRRSRPALRSQVSAAVTAAKHTGFDGLCAEQREYLDDFWARADVQLDGDERLQQAIRFSLFHVLQAGARAEQRAIPAKGLTGSGYDGHTFWDTETFLLPVLTYTAPRAARDALRWRHSTLDLARERATQLGHPGATFPWRTIRGQECSAYWPAGTAAYHINADVSDAVLRYVHATGDLEFEREYGLEILVETARLWVSLGHSDAAGKFRIDGVTGPDEYSAITDNNVYTNLMAQRNLRGAVNVVAAHPEKAAELGVATAEVQRWRRAAESMYVPYDERLGVHPQATGFTDHERWDFENTPASHYPLLLNYPYGDIYRRQVIKQADLVLAMHLRGDAFTPEQKTRNFAYYEALTVRDSSLSACTQAVLAAEIGHMRLAQDYLSEVALTDLDDLHHNTGSGLHMANLAGVWLGLVAGFGGMRDHDGSLTFAPRLAPDWTRLRFGMIWRGRLLRVEITQDSATYELAEGEPLTTRHHGEEITVEAGKAITVKIPPAVTPVPVNQPPGRPPLVGDPNPWFS
ncbi:glycoside hydrolase family 65 protein [Pseudonocardia spinosispora]|uniref:glycoside hydrolase family 65 protein n=1 Tax=Pseudonocardia spinosispora TaxID=103441 RepID=UPI0003FF8599|nr:glycoside hydrolase family 65 protein [Pseudonocardia spinosispora]